MTMVLARTSGVPFDAVLFQSAWTIRRRKCGIAEIDARNSLDADEHLNSVGGHASRAAREGVFEVCARGRGRRRVRNNQA
jgi:hypothetical protein